MTGWRASFGWALGLLLFAVPALAGPTLISTKPAADEATGRISFLVGGIDENGRSLRSSGLEVAIDGQPTPAASTQTLSDWATASSEANQTWRPPLSVGLVYLWIAGAPPGLLDGIHGFFQRVPSRTVVYPTIYGRLRQGRARLTAGDISRLDEIPSLDGYHPNMIEAIRLNLADLGADPAPLKILVLVTDGRDFTDSNNDTPGNFAEIGAELRRAGVTLLVTRFRPEADAAQAEANLRDLHDAAGGFLSPRDQAEELENTLESLGQSVADLQRVELIQPWSWRMLGGSRRFSARFTTIDGQRLTAEVGAVVVDQGASRVVSIVLMVVAALTLALALAGRLRNRSKAAPVPPRVDAVVARAHDLIRRGATPERAVEELTRGNPDGARLLIDMDEALLSDARFPYLRTRPGRKRMQEIRDILRSLQGGHPVLGEAIARVLAEAVEKQQPPESAAQKVTALSTSEERAAFVALDLEQLAEALRSAARAHPPLGTPRARGAVVAIQDSLRSGANRTFGVSVGWLVRAGGPGRRGETLRLDGEKTVIGQGDGCGIRIGGDPSVAPTHAEISLDDGEFSISPLGGIVKLEGERVETSSALVDGETIELGNGIYVFKSAGTLNLATTHRAGRTAGRS